MREHLEDFLACMREAGAIVRKQWSQTKHIRHKGRNDLVTQTDLAVEAFLKESLPRIVTGSDVLGEESSAGQAPGPLTWIVDPVDGTTNYAHGLPLVGVSVGLWQDARVVMGAVYAPMLDELFWAVRGAGAFLNGARIYVSREAKLQSALVSTGFPYSFYEEADDQCATFQRVLLAVQGVRGLGSASIDLAYTACGRVEAYYETGLKPWDAAAGWLLVEEAGGRVSALDGGPFDFSKRMIVASNGAIHEHLLHVLRDA